MKLASIYTTRNDIPALFYMTMEESFACSEEMSDLCIYKKRHERKYDIKELEPKEQWHKNATLYWSYLQGWNHLCLGNIKG